MKSIFKSFIAYQIPPAFVLEQLTLSDTLEPPAPEDAHIARDPEGSAWRAAGLISGDRGYFHNLNGAGVLLRVQINERILPAAVRDEHLKQRVEDVERRQGFKVGRKDFAQLKDEVIFELLPKAFIKRTVVPVMFVAPHWMFIFTSSPKRADDTIAVLNGVFSGNDRWQPRLVSTIGNPVNTLNTIAREAPGDEDQFEADTSAVLKGEDKKTIRIKDLDVYGHEVDRLLREGYDVHELAVSFYAEPAHDEPTLQFVINDKLVFKRLALTGQSAEKITADEHDDLFHALAWLTMSECRVAAAALFDLMGGVRPAVTGQQQAHENSNASLVSGDSTTPDDEDEL